LNNFLPKILAAASIDLCRNIEKFLVIKAAPLAERVVKKKS
jgi:hypothetical protein